MTLRCFVLLLSPTCPLTDCISICIIHQIFWTSAVARVIIVVGEPIVFVVHVQADGRLLELSLKLCLFAIDQRLLIDFKVFRRLIAGIIWGVVRKFHIDGG